MKGTSLAPALFLMLVLVPSCSTIPAPPGPSPRGRAVIAPDGHSFVTDRGHLLRGAYWSTDGDGRLPDRAYLVRLKSLGLNTLHLYGESFAPGLPAGTYQESIDRLVEWTREEGLYLVLTIGNQNQNGSYDLAFARAFWTLYAPRYASEAHVLYELQNEPVAWQAGYDAAALAMEKELYRLVRSLAPASPILLMSYASFMTADGALADVEALRSVVDFGNAAVAFHGYAGTDETRKTLTALLGAGIPCLNTEFADHDPGFTTFGMDEAMISLCEENRVSWLLFLSEGELAPGAVSPAGSFPEVEPFGQ